MRTLSVRLEEARGGGKFLVVSIAPLEHAGSIPYALDAPPYTAHLLPTAQAGTQMFLLHKFQLKIAKLAPATL